MVMLRAAKYQIISKANLLILNSSKKKPQKIWHIFHTFLEESKETGKSSQGKFELLTRKQLTDFEIGNFIEKVLADKVHLISILFF